MRSQGSQEDLYKITIIDQVGVAEDRWAVIVKENMVQGQREAIREDILPIGSVRVVTVEKI